MRAGMWGCVPLVFCFCTSLFAQSKNLVFQGSVNVSPAPQPTLFEVSDLWVQGNFAYLGNLGSREITIVDVTTPSSPNLVCAFDAVQAVEDVVVSGQYLYAARQPGGVRVYDLVNPASPLCPPTFLRDVTGVPGAHNMFIHQPAAGSPLMFVAGLDPTDAVFVLNLADPSNPLLIGTWTQPAGIRYCEPSTDALCGPHDVFAQTVGT